MKMLNKKFVRTLSCAAVAVCAAAMLSVGAFAAEVDSTCVEGYLPPQEQMVQGDIALHSGDVAVGEKDPSYGGYGAPEGNPIQGNIMLISGDELADTAKTEARYTVKGLLGKQLLYTARQKDGVLTLDMNDAYAEAVRSSGTTGEEMLVYSLVNTFASARNAESVMLTVDGKPLQSGHAIYDYALTPMEN